MWDGMVYDPTLGLLYVATGNANPYPRARRSPSGGDNLFAASVLAIDPKTGRLVWHYQETPGDQWDYDSDAPMVLTDLVLDGQQRSVLMHAPKNGFFYLLDRKTGRLLRAGAIALASWADHIDMATGRPVENEDADYARRPRLVAPSTAGGHNWNPMAWDPQTGLAYVPTLDACNLLAVDRATSQRRAGLPNAGANQSFVLQPPSDVGGPTEAQDLLAALGAQDTPDCRMRSVLRAYDPVTQKVVWEVGSADWWSHAGVLATSGGVVVQGAADGHLRVFDARTGAVLKDIDTGTSMVAAPMTYKIGDTQYLAVMCAWGGGGWYLWQPDMAAYRYGNGGRILVFRLGGGVTPKPPPVPDLGRIPRPPAQTASAKVVARGAALFAQNCRACHADAGRGGTPDLTRMPVGRHAAFDRVLEGALVPAGMPRWSDVLPRRRRRDPRLSDRAATNSLCCPGERWRDKTPERGIAGERRSFASQGGRRSPSLGLVGGERGIRTLDRLSPIHAFQACAFNRSATSPTPAPRRLRYFYVKN